MFYSGAGGAEFKSVHLHKLPTYDNLADVSLEKKGDEKNYRNAALPHLLYVCRLTGNVSH